MRTCYQLLYGWCQLDLLVVVTRVHNYLRVEILPTYLYNPMYTSNSTVPFTLIFLFFRYVSDGAGGGLCDDGEVRMFWWQRYLYINVGV